MKNDHLLDSYNFGMLVLGEYFGYPDSIPCEHPNDTVSITKQELMTMTEQTFLFCQLLCDLGENPENYKKFLKDYKAVKKISKNVLKEVLSALEKEN